MRACELHQYLPLRHCVRAWVVAQVEEKFQEELSVDKAKYAAGSCLLFPSCCGCYGYPMQSLYRGSIRRMECVCMPGRYDRLMSDKLDMEAAYDARISSFEARQAVEVCATPPPDLECRVDAGTLLVLCSFKHRAILPPQSRALHVFGVLSNVCLRILYSSRSSKKRIGTR